MRSARATRDSSRNSKGATHGVDVPIPREKGGGEDAEPKW
jgi:hypothetical protein